jgi:DNA polymerase III sliding clamp (beta) subunit (PCNA family)
LEGLGNFSSDEVELFANNEKNPGLFRPKGREDYLYLVMPIRQ